MTTYPQYKRALTDPMPRRAEAYRIHGPGGQHSSPLPRERRQPTPQAQSAGWCLNCFMPSNKPVCSSCQQPPPPPPPKQPQTIEMGPLPEPHNAHQWEPIGSHGLTSTHTDPDPLPIAWATYSPDMSCYTTPIVPLAPCMIDNHAIQHCLRKAAVVQRPDHTHYIYGSKRNNEVSQADRDSMIDFMRRNGAHEYIDGFWLLENVYMRLRVVVRHGVVVEMIDYTVAPSTPPAQISTIRVYEGGAAW